MSSRATQGKKGNPPMENLITFTESVLDVATGSCTRCLIDELGDENSEIADSIARLQTAHFMLLCGTSPGSAEEFSEALASFMTRVVTMAVFTAELMHRPGVRWIDENTEIALPVVTSPN
jgi:hypothetical protein